MKTKNHLERLRFTVVLLNLKEHSPDWIKPGDPNWHDIIDPVVSISIDDTEQQSTLVPGKNTLTFDYTVYDIGEHELKIQIHNVVTNNWLLPPIGIDTVCVQGVPLTISTGVYTPDGSDEQYVGSKLLGERGEWSITFTTPVIEDTNLKIGLWA